MVELIPRFCEKHGKMGIFGGKSQIFDLNTPIMVELLIWEKKLHLVGNAFRVPLKVRHVRVPVT